MEEPQHQGAARLVCQRDAQHRPETEAAFDRRHLALHLRGNPRTQVADRGQRGAILVAARQVQPQVLQVGQTTRGKFFRDGRADARQH